MTTVDLTSRPDMPTASARCSSAALEDRRDRLLDAEVDHRVAVVGQDDVDEVLADVVHVALDRGQHDRALALGRRSSPCAARGGPPRSSSPRRTAARTAAASGPEPNSSPTVFMPDSSVSLMISRAGRCSSASSRSASRPVPLAVDDPPLQPLEQRQRGQLLGAPGLRRRGGDALEQLHEPVQRVVALAGGGRRPGPARPSAARRRSWPSAGSSPRARSRCRARRCTHSCRNTEFSTWRAAALSPKETLEMPSVVCTSGCRRLSSRIASMVSSASRRTSSCPVVIGKVRVSTTMSSTCMPWFVVRSWISRSATRTFQSRGAGLALLVDAQRDDRRAVLADQRHRPLEARAGAVAVLVVDRVDDRSGRRGAPARRAAPPARWSRA